MFIYTIITTTLFYFGILGLNDVTANVRNLHVATLCIHSALYCDVSKPATLKRGNIWEIYMYTKICFKVFYLIVSKNKNMFYSFKVIVSTFGR